jgi:hypothetical protein
MLQCSLCGETFSPWAARCPQCGRTSDDALEVGDVAVAVDPEAAAANVAVVPIFTVDPSSRNDLPRKPPWYGRRPTIAAGAAGLVAALSILVGSLAGTANSPKPAGWIQRLTGTIVAQGSDGAPLTAAPDGAHQRDYRITPMTADQIPQYAAAPDGRFLLQTTGYPSPPRYWSIIELGLHTLTRAAPGALGAFDSAAMAEPAPFADHDHAVVVVSQGFPETQSHAVIVSLADGRTMALGRADAAAADPQTFGAFVSVPVNVPYGTGSSDASIELRDPGESPVTLATAGELNQDVGQAPSTPVDLRVYPDPAGDKLAVMLDPSVAVVANVPMVILDRHGHLLSVLRQTSGPAASTVPAWSPGGRQVAYPTYTSTGPALAIKFPGGQPRIYRAANPDTQIGNCVWSPTVITVVCLARTGTQTAWDFANTTTGTLNSVKSLGYPIVWLPSEGSN